MYPEVYEHQNFLTWKMKFWMKNHVNFNFYKTMLHCFQKQFYPFVFSPAFHEFLFFTIRCFRFCEPGVIKLWCHFHVRITIYITIRLEYSSYVFLPLEYKAKIWYRRISLEVFSRKVQLFSGALPCKWMFNPCFGISL